MSLDLTSIATQINEALNIAEAIAHASTSSLELQKESSRDFATETDISVEQAISQFLIEATPTIPIVGEESGASHLASEANNSYWVIDPIDGTANYSRGIPLFGVCIALVEDGQAVACGISFPRLGERYGAIRGRGATLNGKSLRVSQRTSMDQVIVGFGDFAVGTNREEKNKFRFKLISQLGDECLRIRMLGSAALQLAWLAAGRIDLSVTLSNRAWDVQAGVLLVREAGGMVFDSDGSDHSVASAYTLATNSDSVKAQILNHFRSIGREA